jgi:peptide subunit release factor 1 (eRF1)
MYVTNDRPNVAGLVLSGSADFKTELSQSDMFDPRLQAVVLGVVDVSYGEGGLLCERRGGKTENRAIASTVWWRCS